MRALLGVDIQSWGMTELFFRMIYLPPYIWDCDTRQKRTGSLHDHVFLFLRKYLAIGNIASEVQDNQEALNSHGTQNPV